jgi:multidrug efflux pump subunit AcrB
MVNNDSSNETKPSAAPEDLGLAGNLARAFIHSPLSPLLLVAFLAIGVLGLLITPRQEDPQISVPMVDIMVSYPGASAEQVNTLVADPLMRLMGELTGVKHVYSGTWRGQAIVTVEFDVGENLEESLVKLYDKLESNKDKIPPGVSQPLVKPKAVDDVPVVTLTLWSNEVDDATLHLIALDVMQRLHEVPDTSQSFVVHGRTEQVRIESQPEKLESFGVTLGQLAQTISTANAEQGVGRMETGGVATRLYTGAFLQTREDIERLVIGIRNGRPVYVRDVARVIAGPSEATSMVSYYTGAAYPEDHVGNGASAVTIAISKKKGSNGVTVADDILESVEYLKGRIIPDNVMVSVTRNYGETAREKVNALIVKLFVATGAVAVLVAFFLGLRAATVVVIVIPVVILTTVFSAWVMGYTIDRVSLFALIFSIGILVDDAIVVVENIYRRWLEKGESDTATAVDAVREVGNPTILATFTVIAALLPMGFVRGMMGPYMEPIPAMGSVAMLFSLFAAFVFTPWLTMRLKPTLRGLRKAEEKEHREKERLGRFYHKLIVPLVTHKTLGYGFLLSLFAVFFLVCALFYTKDVRVKMLPLDNKPEFNVVINMPEGTALPVTASLISRLSEEVRKIKEVTAVQTYVGTASPFNFNGLVRHYYLRDQPWQADIQVQLLNKHDRERTSHEIAEEAREILTPMARAAGARIQVVEMPPGPPVLQTQVAEIYGPSAEIRRQVAQDMTEIFEQAENIGDVDNFLEDDYTVWHFDVDREKARRLGISVDDINKTLDMAMGGFMLGDIKAESSLEPIVIILQLPLGIRSDLSRLTQLPVMTPDGRTVPLSELGQFRARIEDKPIYMKDVRRIEYVTGEGVGHYAAPIYGILEVGDLLEDYTAPDGVKISGNLIGPPQTSRQSAFEWTGEWTVTYETFRDMGIAFGAAIILIYMLVVWEFGNFTLPAIVIAPIPLTLLGIIPGHWLFGAEFTATSMIGFIALAGIIVRNSILLVDFTRHEVAKGIDITDAVINACKARTRPIVITAFALVGSASVIITDPIFQGMALSLLFGVLVSTALTLLIIPLGCISARTSFEASAGEVVTGPAGGGGAPPAPQGATGEVAPEGKRGFVGAVMFGIWSVFYYLGFYTWLIIKGVFGLFASLLRRVTGRAARPAPAGASASPSPAAATQKTTTRSSASGASRKVTLKKGEMEGAAQGAGAKAAAPAKAKVGARAAPAKKVATEKKAAPKKKTAVKKKAAVKTRTHSPGGAGVSSAGVAGQGAAAGMAGAGQGGAPTPPAARTGGSQQRSAKGAGRRGIRLKGDLHGE